MEICLSNMPLALTKPPQNLFPSQKHISLRGFGQKSHQYGCVRLVMTKTLALSETSKSASPTIVDTDHELHKETEKEKKSDTAELANCWREIQGENSWEGLLDPINPLLRTEIIRYGEMAQNCYDAFDYDPFSKYCGSCRFPRRNFFKELDMLHRGYDVSRYLYAASNIKIPRFFKKSRWPKVWSNRANWIGYVAVSNDETSKQLGRRDITVAWRGTVTNLEWLEDLSDFLRPLTSEKIPCADPTVKVESGFLDLYTNKDETCPFCKYSAREQILTEIKRLIAKYPNEELSITVTGHSLGSALAVLNAFDIVETGINVTNDGGAVPVTVFSFAGPRVGNVSFKERVEKLGVKVLRVLNVHDVVPKSPGFFLNENLPPVILKLAGWLPWCYSHVGVSLVLDHMVSPYLKRKEDPYNAHNLEAHLHLADGYHGKGKKFEATTDRDPALVNKSCDFLEDKYLIPPSWRQYENKGMVRTKDGRYVQPERPKLDEHPEEMHHYLRQLGLSSDQ